MSLRPCPCATWMRQRDSVRRPGLTSSTTATTSSSCVSTSRACSTWIGSRGWTRARTTPGCHIITDDVDDWHARFDAAGLHVTPIEDMPWGMYEFTLSDPSGNHIRVEASRLRLSSWG